ncbi:hypothetical protein FGB62_21g49 [Gracilaria domingensis]|nr:hypothetical protein FGB62_21g49 [Gracilaria domingensis]
MRKTRADRLEEGVAQDQGVDGDGSRDDGGGAGRLADAVDDVEGATHERARADEGRAACGADVLAAAAIRGAALRGWMATRAARPQCWPRARPSESRRVTALT